MFDISVYGTFSPEFKKIQHDRVNQELTENHLHRFESRIKPVNIVHKSVKEMSTQELHQQWNELLTRVKTYEKKPWITFSD